MEDNLHPILKAIIPCVEGIAKTFGTNCEVALHDFSNLEKSIIAIENGHVTERNIGSPMTEVGLQALQQEDIKDNMINYTSKSTDGRALKTTTIFIKDEQKNIIGCLCINFDISELIVAQNALYEMTQTKDKSTFIAKDSCSNRIYEALETIVVNTLEEAGKPVAYMNKDEKVMIVEKLNHQGVFLIKGAIDYVAKVLCVSRYTIYNYLDEIRINHK